MKYKEEAREKVMEKVKETMTMEIASYIFYLINRKKYSGLYDKAEYDKQDKKVKKKSKVTKEMKNKKAIEADIEE